MMERHKLVILSLFAALNIGIVNNAVAEGCPNTKGKVARALVTTAVENREPVNRVLILENNFPEIFFFSDLRHMQGQKIVHRWEYEGEVVMRKSFDIKGPRWRIFSRKELDPDKVGRWTVVITDKDDCPLKAVVFQYVKENPEGRGSAIINLRNN